MPTPSKAADPGEKLTIKVLGRTIEHFGVQMYKRREVAIAELVANCWDAGAQRVEIELPNPADYRRATAQIVVRDYGCGMTFEEVRDEYLVIGRNRRQDGGAETQTCLALFPDERAGASLRAKTSKKEKVLKTRRVMGRKGVGKLAGFGLATRMTVKTWRQRKALQFMLDLDRLKAGDNGAHDVPINWEWVDSPSKAGSGTEIVLEGLKHKSPLEPKALGFALARRFSRTVRGQMIILIDGNPLPDPCPALRFRFPADHTAVETEKLLGGAEVRYWYGFAEDTIKDREQRGFAVLVNGKVAQAPPFFFNVEATASGQHSTRYVTGDIEADFLDAGTDDDSDLVSTDRQEIDWESEAAAKLKAWGERKTRDVLMECASRQKKDVENKLLSDEELAGRINALDQASQRQISRLLGVLAGRDDDFDRTRTLADGLVQAFEFRHFHDLTDEIVQASDDPDRLALILQHLKEWNVLESRAIREVIHGRLHILEKFERMLVNNAPETASKKSLDNLHDLLAGNPWLLNPEWQVLVEERSITKQLREWGKTDDGKNKGRFDFLALGDDKHLVVIEIKRPGHPTDLVELQRLEGYLETLAKAHGGKEIRAVLIHGGELNVTPDRRRAYERRPDFELREWFKLFEKTKRIYQRYRAVLERAVTHPDFKSVESEVIRARGVMLAGTVHRDPKARRRGLGAQDPPSE